MKSVFLLVVREVNQEQKRLSQNTLELNYKIHNEVIKRLSNIQAQYLTDLHPHQKQAVIEEFLKSKNNRETIDSFIETIDTDDPSSEGTETRLDRIKYESKTETIKMVGNILNHLYGDLGPEYNKLISIRDRLDKGHRKYTELHIDNVNAGMEIDKLIEENNKGSLVSDYADPNTEMPSYMDPED